MPSKTKSAPNKATQPKSQNEDKIKSAPGPLGYTTALKVYGSWPAAVEPLLSDASRTTLRGAFRAAGMNPKARLSKAKMRLVLARIAPSVNAYYFLADAFVPKENS